MAYVVIVVGGSGGGAGDDGGDVRISNTDSSGDYDNDDNYTMIFALKR